jgi:hypothetical protein
LSHTDAGLFLYVGDYYLFLTACQENFTFFNRDFTFVQLHASGATGLSL